MLNMMSPAISLMIPFLFLVLPFLLLKLRGLPITVSMYIDVLKDIAKHHFIGKALTNLSNMSVENMIYLVLGAGMYFYQIYQNMDSPSVKGNEFTGKKITFSKTNYCKIRTSDLTT